jgi:Mrp family chromosome partitioning ATPase
MLDALKALDARSPAEPPAPLHVPPPASSTTAASSTTPAAPVEVSTAPIVTAASEDPAPRDVDWDKSLDETTALVDEAAEMFGLPPLVSEDPLEVAPAVKKPAAVQPVVNRNPQPTTRRATLHAPPFETCTLPIVGEPAEYYLETAARVCDQGSSNYSNVLLFVSADRGSEACFSMPDLAHAFALQLAGDVLLIDGDLRQGRLSKQVSRPGAGMVEAMLGQAQWPDLIHPTNIARIDFVARGIGQVPTFERPHFGWSALRPLYRAVLIGPANQAEPETLWLAARCDAVYFVLSRLHTRRSNATAAVNALRAGGANIAGCIVVND